MERKDTYLLVEYYPDWTLKKYHLINDRVLELDPNVKNDSKVYKESEIRMERLFYVSDAFRG